MIPKNEKPLAPAATVVLVRPHEKTFQVYLLRRSGKSGFMGGLYVFPGGRVDAEDMDAAVWGERVDLAPADIALRLGGGLDPDTARAYGVAAIRETLEEAGVFLAIRNGNPGKDLDRICELRLSDTLSKDWFSDRVRQDGWKLNLGALRRWSHWITPRGMKKRFDTRFFLAVIPEDQSCRPDLRETVHGLWVTPEAGLQGNLDRKIPLSPPTVVTLHQLLSFADFNALLAETESRPWGDPVRPRMIPLEKGVVILEPWDPMYGEETIDIDIGGLESAVAPVGRPFSRIWLHRGLWRPLSVR
jgi:8-oxo-dGTP pyrophosphatase MutT (NUDIX family)